MSIQSAATRRLGLKDSRGPQGEFARGKNVYKNGSNAAHSGGGPQFGRPAAPKKGKLPDIYFHVGQRDTGENDGLQSGY